MKAIKEWASIVCALESGAQTVLLRKGGIHDAPSGFREESGTFLLFPTYEHQKREHLKESGIQYATKSDANAPPPGKVCIRSTAEVLRGADVDADANAEKLKGISRLDVKSLCERETNGCLIKPMLTFF